MSLFGVYKVAGNSAMAAFGSQWFMPIASNSSLNTRPFIAPMTGRKLSEFGFPAERWAQMVTEKASGNTVIRIDFDGVPNVVNLKAIDDGDCMFEAATYDSLDNQVSPLSINLSVATKCALFDVYQTFLAAEQMEANRLPEQDDLRPIYVK